MGRKGTGIGDPTADNLRGLQFGRLRVVKYDHADGSHHVYRCVCECGGVTHVRARDLITGRVKSCGCMARQMHKKISTAALDEAGIKFRRPRRR